MALIRFHLDEHIDPAVAEGLRRRGIEATTTLEQGLEGVSDESQLEAAGANGSVLVTRDHHFLAFASSGRHHSGIVYWVSKHTSIGDLIQDLAALHSAMHAEDMVDQVRFV